MNIGPGSGLIKRCPVEGCNRVLSKRNYCPVHEVQNDFRYDLRIKAVLDDGVKAHNILMLKEVVEADAGLTLGRRRENRSGKARPRCTHLRAI